MIDWRMVIPVRTSLRVGRICLLFLAAVIPVWSQVTITTERYDSSRTGANLNEDNTHDFERHLCALREARPLRLRGVVQYRPSRFMSPT